MIKINSLVKKFNAFRAVDKISFEVKKGEIFGLLGHNGAGKTTTIRMLTGIIKPTSGTAIIGGYNIQKNPIKAKQLMGIVPEMANVYVDFSPLKNLLLMGELYGLDRNKRIERAEQLLKLFGLYEKRNQKSKTLSKGLKQRLIICMGLMNEPKLLFLDEPTSGLDVESVRLIKGLIRKFNNEGVTIVLTTHNIEEAGQLCDRIAIMNHGKIVAIEHPEKLKHLIKSAISIEVAFDKKAERDELTFNNVSKVEKRGDKFKLYTEYPEDVIPMLVKYSQLSDNKIISLNTLTPNLEDIFLKLVKNKEK
ncbi:MAG: ATP-binding cassette domain-containing protein [Xanthomonadaceae bacterium]|nr:ATP-binding cassette domain-containing protein [Rhodospirillaceae bacterium]NIA18198.1 ATP-binding cassette domain-containing protein [Xanthomonadaceae bacterium]